MIAKPSQIVRARSPWSAGLVGAWLLGEGSGPTVRDWSGYGSQGAITAADIATIWGVSPYGRATTLDGANDSISITDGPHLQIAGSLTMLALICPSAFDVNRYLISKYACSIYTTAAGVTIFETRKADNLGWDSNASGPSLSLGAWAVLIGVFDAGAGTKRLWVNGIAGTAVAKTDGGCGAMTSFAWALGRNLGVAGRFAGQMGLGAIWSRAMVPAEILRLTADPFLPFRLLNRLGEF